MVCHEAQAEHRHRNSGARQLWPRKSIEKNEQEAQSELNLKSPKKSEKPLEIVELTVIRSPRASPTS